jgi:uncharacterized membrane protein
VPEAANLRFFGLLAFVVLSNVIGNLLLSVGVRGQAYGYVVIGVGLLIAWTLARITLMSRADLSYILPVTAVGYILTAIAGRVFLSESISTSRWAGTSLIVLGTIVVGSTRPRT